MNSAFLQIRLRSSWKWMAWGGLIIGATLLAFWYDLLVVFNAGLVDEGYSQVVLLPFIVGYLVYSKRHFLRAIGNLPDRRRFGDIWTVLGGSIMLAAFVGCYYATGTTFVLEWRLLMLPVFVTGMVLAIFGYRFWRQIAVPILFLVFFEPYFVVFSNQYWNILSDVSAIGVQGILGILRVGEVLTYTVTGPVITVGGVYDFGIGVGSSSIQVLVGYTLFAAVAAYILAGPVLKRVALFILGYPLLVAMNIVRISIIAVLTEFVGQTAGTIFHLTGGLFLVFLGTILLLFMGQRFFGLGFLPTPSRSAPCRHTARADGYCLQCGTSLPGRNAPTWKRSQIVGALLVLFVTVLLLPIQTPAYAQVGKLGSIDIGSGSPSVLTGLLPATVDTNQSDWQLHYDYRDNTTQGLLQDNTLVFSYNRTSTFSYNRTSTAGQTQSILVVMEIGPFPHSIQDSLRKTIVFTTPFYNQGGISNTTKITNQTTIVTARVTTNVTTSVTGNFFVYQYHDPSNPLLPPYNASSLEWQFDAYFDIGDTPQFQYVTLYTFASVSALSDTGLIANNTAYNQILQQYLPFGQAFVGLWAPYVVTGRHLPVSPTTGLVGLVIAPDALALLVYSSEASSKKRVAGRILQGTASSDDTLLLRSVQSANKSGGGSFDEIRSQLATMSGKEVSEEGLAASLSRASELGLVEPRIAEKFGAPQLIWKLENGVQAYFSSKNSSSSVGLV